MSCHTCHIGAKNSHLSNAVGDKRGSLRSLKNLILNLILNQIPIQNLIQKSKFKITSHSEFSLWSSRFQDFDFQVDFRSQLDSRVFSFSYFQDFSVSGQKCAKVEFSSELKTEVISELPGSFWVIWAIVKTPFRFRVLSSISVRFWTNGSTQNLTPPLDSWPESKLF